MTVDRINLLPPELIAKRHAQKKYALAGLAGVVLVAVVGLIYLFLAAQVAIEKQRLESMQAEFTRLKAVISTFDKYKKEEQELEKAEQLISSVKTQKVSWSDVLDHVGFIIPEEVQLDSFMGSSDTPPGSVTFSGRASSFEGVASFIVRLQNSEKFKEVALKNIGLDAETGSITFSIETMLAEPGGAAATEPQASGG